MSSTHTAAPAGAGRPTLQVHVSYAADEETALAVAHDQWRNGALGPPACWDTDSVEAFDAITELVRPDDLRDVRADLERSRPARRVVVERAELGFDAVQIHHVGADQPEFLEVFGAKVLPELARRLVKITDTSDIWWKTAVVYCLDVETYLDSDGDGIGDLAGLVQRLDHLADLGVTCVWLMPIYPTPDRDDGYDITDHYGIDPRLGTHGDFVEVVRTARDRGMRVILDLVVNHTSDHHPWFRAARSSPPLAVPRLVRVERRSAAHQAVATWCSPTRSRASGPTTSRPARTTSTASTATSPT